MVLGMRKVLAISHSRPQSPSFLGHVVGKRGRLQIKPSGSGDENGHTPEFHRRKMSAHALEKMTRDQFRVISLAPRRKYPRNVVQMKEAMAAFFWQ